MFHRFFFTTPNGQSGFCAIRRSAFVLADPACKEISFFQGYGSGRFINKYVKDETTGKWLRAPATHEERSTCIQVPETDIVRPGPEYMLVSEYSKHINVPISTLQSWITQGRLETLKYRGLRWIHRDFPKPLDGRRKTGAWSKTRDNCAICLRNDRKHLGHGMCVICYTRQYRTQKASAES